MPGLDGLHRDPRRDLGGLLVLPAAGTAGSAPRPLPGRKSGSSSGWPLPLALAVLLVDITGMQMRRVAQQQVREFDRCRRSIDRTAVRPSWSAAAAARCDPGARGSGSPREVVPSPSCAAGGSNFPASSCPGTGRSPPARWPFRLHQVGRAGHLSATSSKNGYFHKELLSIYLTLYYRCRRMDFSPGNNVKLAWMLAAWPAYPIHNQLYRNSNE